MEKSYKPLNAKTLQPGAGVEVSSLAQPKMVNANSPAVEVMTDLKQVPVATIDAETPIETALINMISRGVRSLMVVEGDSVVGLITARDLQGERPMQVVQGRGLKYGEILVKHIMTKRESIEVLEMSDVLNAKVGHILSTLKHAGRQHALVTDKEPESGRQMIRGIYSLSQIARQMGLPIQATELAKTFSEIESVIAA